MWTAILVGVVIVIVGLAWALRNAGQALMDIEKDRR